MISTCAYGICSHRKYSEVRKPQNDELMIKIWRRNRDLDTTPLLSVSTVRIVQAHHATASPSALSSQHPLHLIHLGA